MCRAAEYHVAAAAPAPAVRAPTIRSANPSPLMSPAFETLKPLKSPAHCPLITKPPFPPPPKIDLLPTCSYARTRRNCDHRRLRRPPTTRSAIPSPFTSPAPDTLKPLWSPGALTIDHKAASACRHRRKVYRRRTRTPKDHEAAAHCSLRADIRGSNDQVANSVAVHIPSARYAAAAEVGGALPVYHEATRPRRNHGQCPLPQYPCAQRPRSCGKRGSSAFHLVCPDDQVRQAVAIHVTGT